MGQEIATGDVRTAGIEYVEDGQGAILAMVVRHDFEDYAAFPPYLDSEGERRELAAGYAGTDPETERRTKAHITADDLAFQITLLNRPPGAVTKPHYHHVATERAGNATRQKLMMCRSGRMRANVYTASGEHVADVDLAPGDFVLTFEGHGYEFLEAGTRALEIMEGPLLPGAGFSRVDLEARTARSER